MTENQGASDYVEVHSTACHAGSDGDCSWAECPQERDGEPHATGRYCPLAKQPVAAWTKRNQGASEPVWTIPGSGTNENGDYAVHVARGDVLLCACNWDEAIKLRDLLNAREAEVRGLREALEWEIARLCRGCREKMPFVKPVYRWQEDGLWHGYGSTECTGDILCSAPATLLAALNATKGGSK